MYWLIKYVYTNRKYTITNHIADVGVRLTWSIVLDYVVRIRKNDNCILHHRGWIVQESERGWLIVNYRVNHLLLKMNFCTDINVFKSRLNLNIIYDKPTFVYVGSRLGQIFHARICMGCSALNSDLFRKNTVKGKYVALSRYVIVRTVEKIMSRSLYSTTCTTRWIYNIFPK
jgi:hypothetical protein